MVASNQHFSPVTQRWEKCDAKKKACRYIADPHRFENASVALAEREQALAPQVEQERKSFVQGMMSRFFGGKPTVNSVAPTPAVVPAGTVVERFGRLKVMSEDTVSHGAKSLYVFGDYTSQEDAQALHDADPLKAYQNGECGVLAGELWNRNPHVEEYYFFSIPEDREWGTHHFVKLKDGSFADSMGVWSESAFVSYWKEIDKNVSLEVYEEGQPVPDKNPNIEVSNQKLFDAITKSIENHFSKQ